VFPLVFLNSRFSSRFQKVLSFQFGVTLSGIVTLSGLSGQFFFEYSALFSKKSTNMKSCAKYFISSRSLVVYFFSLVVL